MLKYVYILITLLLAQVGGNAAVDLIQQVPAKDPAFACLRVLDQQKMLTTGRDALFIGNITRTKVTRYDIALAMIEPLNQFIALADTGTAGNSPEQYLRRESAYRLITSLSSVQLVQLLNATNQLLVSFADVIEELSPGLPAQAAAALRKIDKAVMELKVTGGDPNDRLSFRVTVDPKAVPDSFGSPLPLLPIKRTDLSARPFTLSRPGDGDLLGIRPVNSLEAAVELAFSGFRLYGYVSTLEKDPRMLIKPEQLSGSAMLGLQFNIIKLDDLGITGILEYHVLRSSDPGDISTNTGGVGGIGIIW